MQLENKLLEELRERLLGEKKQIETELERIARPTGIKGDYETKFTDIGPDEDENASEVEEYSDNLALEHTLEKQLSEVSEALDRIKDGTYGKCSNCDQMIPIERLRAYPAAKICTGCAK